MPTRYLVRGVDATGRPVRREVVAESMGEAEGLAAAAGMTVRSVAVAEEAAKAAGGGAAGAAGSGTGSGAALPPQAPALNPFDSAQDGSELTVWTGTPSHWSNFWIYAAAIFVIPIPWSLWSWLSLRASRIVLTTQRLRIESGVLSKKFEELELYRVRDSSLAQTFWQRMAGIGDVILETTDASTPHVRLRHLHRSFEVREQIRAQVERVRRVQRVREIEMS